MLTKSRKPPAVNTAGGFLLQFGKKNDNLYTLGEMSMRIDEALNIANRMLSQNSISDAKSKARRVLANVLGKTKEYILIHSEEEISDDLYREFIDKVDRLNKFEPIQYIIGSQEFMGLDFYVDNKVLIPQPDTEVLVEEVLKNISNQEERLIVLDLCTGSGAIAISIAKYAPNSIVYASDISSGAIKIAEKNSKKNGVNISLLESNIFENISNTLKFDIVVSNPPYVESDVIKDLDKEVQNEPRIALDGGKDGLDFYRRIIKESKDYINQGGFLFLEIGYNQKEKVMKLLEENEYKDIYSRKDYAGNDRIVVGRRE